jgi:hypothetical protein
VLGERVRRRRRQLVVGRGRGRGVGGGRDGAPGGGARGAGGDVAHAVGIAGPPVTGLGLDERRSRPIAAGRRGEGKVHHDLHPGLHDRLRRAWGLEDDDGASRLERRNTDRRAGARAARAGADVDQHRLAQDQVLREIGRVLKAPDLDDASRHGVIGEQRRRRQPAGLRHRPPPIRRERGVEHGRLMRQRDPARAQLGEERHRRHDPIDRLVVGRRTRPDKRDVDRPPGIQLPEIPRRRHRRRHKRQHERLQIRPRPHEPVAHERAGAKDGWCQTPVGQPLGAPGRDELVAPRRRDGRIVPGTGTCVYDLYRSRRPRRQKSISADDGE